MKKIYFILIVLFVTAVFPALAQTQTESSREGNLRPSGSAEVRQEGIASWYGREFEGRPTASGEIFDSSQLTAAHPNLPFGTLLVVTNLHNNKSVTVRINDRGPFVPARIIDVSRAAAERLDMIITGTAPVRIESTGRTSVSNPGNPVVGTQVTVPQSTTVQPSATPVITDTAPRVRIENVQAASGTVIVTQPVVVQPYVLEQPSQFRLSPSTLNIVPEKNYRLQIGSFRVARNAVAIFDRLKSAGLSPAYERYTDSEGDYFRVVLANIRGSNVQATSEKLSAAGFKEAIIREEN